MLFLLFKIGKDRYALEASRVVEVVPLLELKRIPQAPPGFAGLFNYRGLPVPAIDLCELSIGQPARERLSTRIIIVRCTHDPSRTRSLGLIAEQATEMIRKEPKDFVDPGFKVGSAPYLGPVLLDANGPIQWVHEQHLLSERIRHLIYDESAPQFPDTGRQTLARSTPMVETPEVTGKKGGISQSEAIKLLPQ